MKGIGKMIYNMDMEKRFGQIIRNMKVNKKKKKSMVKGFMSGQMEVCMKESGMRIELKEKESTPGLMEDNTQVSGRIITCMDMEFTLGKMEEGMKDIMKWIKNMDMVSINGLMGENMKVIGKMESSMGKENTYFLMELLKLESGTMAKEPIGLMNEPLNINIY